MEYESACDGIRDDIASLLLSLDRPSSRTAFAAARATGDVAAALHHAAGIPDDPRWLDAFASLEEFLVQCSAFPQAASSPAMLELRRFVAENNVTAMQQLAG